METKRILLAEDDEDIVEILRLYLSAQGYQVLWAHDGEEAFRIFQEQQVHLLMADLMMPKINGYELIRKIRETSNLPILIISAKNMDADKILGLNLGADVYITKPFNPLEVVAYVNAAFRRFYELGAEEKSRESHTGETLGDVVLTLGDLQLNTERLELTKKGVKIPLTPAELKILMQLMKSPGRVYTKAQLYECVNGEFYENTDNTMMVHIANLRSKIEDDPSAPEYIKTIRGLGYKIENIAKGKE